MFISEAFAQGASGVQDVLSNIVVPLAMTAPIIYFLVIRPQQQRVKQHRDMIDKVRRGDIVVTSGGIIGTVTKVRDDAEIEVEIAKDTRIRVLKATLAEVRVKGEPVKEAG